MAEVDYLDLMLKQNLPELNLEEIRKQAIAQAASKKPVLNAKVMPEVQVQSEGLVADTPLDINEYIQQPAYTTPELKQQRESANILGRRLQGDVAALGENIQTQRQARQPYIDKLNQLVETYMQPAPRFESQYADIAKKIAEQDLEGNKREAPPQEDLLTKAIYAFGPGALGLMTGEPGMEAAGPAQRGSYALREQERKQALEAYKTRQSEGSKRQLALKLLMDTEQEAFNKQQEQQDKRLGQAQKIISSLSEDESKRLDNAIQDQMDLLKVNYDKGFSSQKEYADSVNKLAQLKNALDIAKMNLQASENRFQASEAGKEKRAARAESKQAFGEAAKLRTEFNQRPVVKDFASIQSAYQRLQETAKKPSAAGDISLIFSYMKMLDPNSTVREGEFATAQNAAGVSDQVTNLYNRVVNGQRLNPKQRQDYLNQADALYQGQLKERRRTESEFKELGKKLNVDPSVIFTPAPQSLKQGGGTGNMTRQQKLEYLKKKGYK